MDVVSRGTSRFPPAWIAIANRSEPPTTSPKRKRHIGIPVGVAYGTDTAVVEELLLDAAREESSVLERPKPRVRFREFGDSAPNFELLCRVSNPARTARITHELDSTIHHAFRDAGVEIPSPQRDVHLRTTEAADPATDATPTTDGATDTAESASPND